LDRLPAKKMPAGVCCAAPAKGIWTMSIYDGESRPSTDHLIIVAPFVRIERERDGEGWVVIAANGHGWLFGDRRRALREKFLHDRQWGRS
jgi:hypothetical protein